MECNLKKSVIARFQRKRGNLFVFFLVLFLFNISHAENKIQFMPGLSDVPMYKDVKIFADSIVEFDSSWGSIKELDANCECSCKAVNKYYADILPNVGWDLYPTEDGNNIYIRDGAELTIHYQSTKYGCEINFSETH